MLVFFFISSLWFGFSNYVLLFPLYTYKGKTTFLILIHTIYWTRHYYFRLFYVGYLAFLVITLMNFNDKLVNYKKSCDYRIMIYMFNYTIRTLTVSPI